VNACDTATCGIQSIKPRYFCEVAIRNALGYCRSLYYILNLWTYVKVQVMFEIALKRLEFSFELFLYLHSSFIHKGNDMLSKRESGVSQFQILKYILFHTICVSYITIYSLLFIHGD